jgi:hypothetical protein
MSIRFALSTAAALALGIAAAGQAQAQVQASAQKQCSIEYQAAKAANSLNGQSWSDFYKSCRARMAEPAAAAAAPAPAAAPVPAPAPAPAPAPVAAAPIPAPAPAPAPVAAPAPTPSPAAPATAAGKPVSPGRAAMLERQKKCAAEWDEKKDEIHRADPKAKWPQFWSQCNKRLKAAAQ